MDKIALKKSKKLRKKLAAQPFIDVNRFGRINKQVKYLQRIIAKPQIGA